MKDVIAPAAASSVRRDLYAARPEPTRAEFILLRSALATGQRLGPIPQALGSDCAFALRLWDGEEEGGAADELASVVVKNVRTEAARQLLTVTDKVRFTGIKRNRLYKLFRGKANLDLYDSAAFSEALHVPIESLIIKR